MSTIGLNTSTQACWPLVNYVISQQLLQASQHMQQTLSQLILNMKHERDSDVIFSSQVK